MAAATSVALILGTASYSAAAAGRVGPEPGSPGLGDRLYPTLGNGGYDAQHYDLSLRYATSAPAQALVGTITMTAVATQWLSRFDLDFRGGGPAAVTVDGAPAAFARPGGELVITPVHAIPERPPLRRAGQPVHRVPDRARTRTWRRTTCSSGRPRGRRWPASPT